MLQIYLYIIKNMSAQSYYTGLLADAGVFINGPKPTDIQIHNERVFGRIASGGFLAIGESFMDGDWDVQDLAGCFTMLLNSGMMSKIDPKTALWLALKSKIINLQSKERSFEVGEQHYDLGNDLYEKMLGQTMVYTSGMWEGVDNLDDAQIQKMEQLCQKMKLKPGQRILDIGCGWGSLMKYAAEHYGVSCVGLTVSVKQTEWAKASTKGLPIEYVIGDYRDYSDPEGFDHIVSVEMIEAVGPKNFRTYFEKIHEWLKPGGTFMLQSIISNDIRPKADPWIDKYIFPNGILPSLNQISDASRHLLIIEDIKNIGPDYDPTLMAWWNNFDAHYQELREKNEKYDERFYRMWKYYLQMCAALARSRMMQDYQILFSKKDQ